MTRAAILGFGALGMVFVARAALVYRGLDPLAFGLVLLIGAGLALGVVELLVRATRIARLATELAALPRSEVSRSRVDATPQPLRSMLEAKLVGAPVRSGAVLFTPYLLGLLVMMGLLGTFLGLFETLRGAREALTTSGDVTALREGLAAPMKGLSRAFGTSAAGVSASAMLGLCSVFLRRAEGRFSEAFSAFAAGALFPLTLAGRQLAALEALAESREALPQAARAIEQVSRRLGALEKRLASQQLEANESTLLAFRGAADAVRADVSAGVARAADAIQPVLDRAVLRAGEVARDELVRAQSGLDAHVRAVSEVLVDASRTLDARFTEIAAKTDHSADRADLRDRERLATVAGAAERIEAQVERFTALLDEHARRAAATDLERVEATRATLANVDAQLSHHLASLGARLAEPLADAARATQAGPEAVALLVRAETERLAERERTDQARDARLDALLGRFDAVSAALLARAEEHAGSIASLEQRLDRERSDAAAALSDKLAAHVLAIGQSLARAGTIVHETAEIVKQGGTEMSAVAEMFTSAVDRYREASEAWLDRLSALESSHGASGAGDAQDLLGAYLDQTREVFDHSLAFQRELFTELRALQTRGRG